jgi:hypothetical protein
VRVRFAGRTPLHGRLDPLAHQLRDVPTLSLHVDAETVAPDRAFGIGASAEQSVSVTHVHDGTAPDHDLDVLASGTDAIGVLAQLRRALAQDHLDALPDALRETLRRVPGEVTRSRVFAGVSDPAISDAVLADLIRAQIDRLLDALLAQREAPAQELAS